MMPAVSGGQQNPGVVPDVTALNPGSTLRALAASPRGFDRPRRSINANEINGMRTRDSA
jgi:hypothetical protein